MDTAESLKRNFLKPAIAGCIGGLLTVQQGFGEWKLSSSLPFVGGKRLSPYQYGALVGVLSSFIVESLNNIFLTVAKDNRLKTAESFVMHTVGSMGTWALIPGILGEGGMPPPDVMIKLGTIGFLSEIASQWVHENFIESGSFGQDVLDFI